MTDQGTCSAAPAAQNAPFRKVRLDRTGARPLVEDVASLWAVETETPLDDGAVVRCACRCYVKRSGGALLQIAGRRETPEDAERVYARVFAVEDAAGLARAAAAFDPSRLCVDVLAPVLDERSELNHLRNLATQGAKVQETVRLSIEKASGVAVERPPVP